MAVKMTKSPKLSQREIRQRLRAAYDAILEADAAPIRQDESATPAERQSTEIDQHAKG